MPLGAAKLRHDKFLTKFKTSSKSCMNRGFTWMDGMEGILVVVVEGDVAGSP